MRARCDRRQSCGIKNRIVAATTSKTKTTYGNCLTAAESRRQSIWSDFENAWARSLLGPCRRLGSAEREIIEHFSRCGLRAGGKPPADAVGERELGDVVLGEGQSCVYVPRSGPP